MKSHGCNNLEISFSNDVEFVEALTIYEGLKKMAKFWWDLYPLIIELDSQNVIRLITNKLASWSKFGWLVEEIQDPTRVVAN